MALTEEQKLKIQEEEAYRAEVRGNGKKKKGIGCFGIVVIVALIGAASVAMLSTINPTRLLEKAKNEQLQQANGQYTFDVPSLIGKNFDGVVKILGEPQGKDPTALQVQQGIKEWEKSFMKDNEELSVSYDIASKKIIDFFIPTDDPSGATTNTAHLLQIGNLRTDDQRYRVEFVKTIKATNSFTGIIASPN